MISFILNLLEKLPYRTNHGLSIANLLKDQYYKKIGKNKNPEKCLCGGRVITVGAPFGGWETTCNICHELYDED